jgi:hypothetical protein
VHVNNLENITEENAEAAARVLRDLRDPCLLASGYHWLLVGTTDAVRIVAGGTEQVRTVFNFSGELEPLDPQDVLERIADHPINRIEELLPGTSLTSLLSRAR